jgi:hypothetical protein
LCTKIPPTFETPTLPDRSGRNSRVKRRDSCYGVVCATTDFEKSRAGALSRRADYAFSHRSAP